MKKYLTLLTAGIILILSSCATNSDIEISVTGVSLDKTSLTMTEGDTQSLTAMVMPEDATDKSVTWSSDNTSVADVSSSGIVTAKSPGTATITVKTNDGDKTATCSVTVKSKVIPVTGVSLDKSELTMTEGDTQSLTATFSPENATDKSVTWSSDNESVAMVSSTGVVIARSAGTAMITATAGEVSAECIVTVTVFADPAGAVDLGIVMTREDGSTYGLFWAKSNLCESGLCANPEDYGDYYAWGETEARSGSASYHNWGYYKWDQGMYNALTKYNNKSKYGTVDNITELQRGEKVGETIDDAARAKLGGKWRMPMDAEWTALREQCTWKWTTQNGVNGRLVTASNGNSIFLPAAGYRHLPHE